jgi:hypothetical protein
MSSDEARLRFDGNRVWRVETPDGPVIQKLYNRRGRWPAEEFRAVMTALIGRKTSSLARQRRETERRQLALWRLTGFDVPREISAEHPGLAGPTQLILEYLDGPKLLDLLKPQANTSRADRNRLLYRYGTLWRERHDVALSTCDPTFLHEHGTLAHVILCGDRMVTIDLEQGYRSGGTVMPMLAKEVASTLRSLMSRAGEQNWPDDVRALVAGYGDRRRLARVVDEYLHNPRWSRALLWRLDRIRERRSGRRVSKFTALEALEQTLAEPEASTSEPSAPEASTQGARTASSSGVAEGSPLG